MQQLLGVHILSQPGVHSAALLARGFFPGLIAKPFASGLHMAFLAAAALCFLGAVFSWLRGTVRALDRHSLGRETEEGLASVGEIAMAEAGVGSPTPSSEAVASFAQPASERR
jgi:hypothetical protein